MTRLKSAFAGGLMALMMLPTVPVQAEEVSMVIANPLRRADEVQRLQRSIPEAPASQNVLSDRVKAFMERADELEDIRVGLNTPAAVPRPTLLECRPKYWEFRFMPPPYYNYIANPQAVCEF